MNEQQGTSRTADTKQEMCDVTHSDKGSNDVPKISVKDEPTCLSDSVEFREKEFLENLELINSERLPEVSVDKKSQSSPEKVNISTSIRSFEPKVACKEPSISVETGSAPAIDTPESSKEELKTPSEAEFGVAKGCDIFPSKSKNRAIKLECNKLKMRPVVNLLKVDIDQTLMKVTTKQQSKRKAKSCNPQSKTSLKRKCVKKKLISKKSKCFPRSRYQANVKAKTPIASQTPSLSLDAEDFVSGVCRVCGEQSNECTNIFNDKEKYDRIIEKFLPISVDKSDKLPKTVCKNCLSVLIAVNNLSMKCTMKQAQKQPSSGIKEISVQKPNIDKVRTCKSPKSRNFNHPKPIPQVPASLPKKTTTLSKGTSLPSLRSSLATKLSASEQSSLRPTASNIDCEIQILNSFSLAATENPKTSKGPHKTILSDNKTGDGKNYKPLFAAKMPVRVRPERKVVPPAKFDNFVKSSTPKERSKPLVIKPSNATKEAIDLKEEVNPKKIQYSFDPTSGSFEDESPASPKPVKKRVRKSKKEVPPENILGNKGEKAGTKADKTVGDCILNQESMPRKVSSGELENDAENKNQQDSQNEGNKTKAVARPKKKALSLINANDTTNMIDLNTVGMLTSSLSEEIQKALHLIKNYLIVKVLIPDANSEDGTGSKVASLSKDSPAKGTSEIAKDLLGKKSLATEPIGQNLKQVVEATVEVFSIKIKNSLVPVYFKVVKESFPSAKVKKTIFTTITQTLTKQRNDIRAAWEAEKCMLVPSIFKKLSDNFDPNQSLQQCVKCDKKFPRNEILNHVKYSHLVQCVPCKIARHSYAALQYHTSTVHPLDPKKCRVCGKLYPAPPNQLEHCSHWHRCSICGQGFLDHNAYVKHEMKHIDSDFLEYLFKLEPSLQNSAELKKLKSEFIEKEDGRLLLDYFWEKSDILYSITLIVKDKVFCIKCFRLFKNLTVIKNHLCTGEDKCLQVSFCVYKCVKCKRRFKAKSTYFVHYQECVDRNFDIMRALATYSEKILIECAICATVHESIEKFNNHFDLCFETNIFHCDRCDTKIILQAKGKHLKYCRGPIINKEKSISSGSRSDKIWNNSSNSGSVKIFEDVVDVDTSQDNVDGQFERMKSPMCTEEDKTTRNVEKEISENEKAIRPITDEKSAIVEVQTQASEKPLKPLDNTVENKLSPRNFDFDVNENGCSATPIEGNELPASATQNDTSKKQLQIHPTPSSNVGMKIDDKVHLAKSVEVKEPSTVQVQNYILGEGVKIANEIRPIISDKTATLLVDANLSPPVTGQSSQDSASKRGHDDAPVDESIIDFLGSVCSTPLPKKTKTASRTDGNIGTDACVSQASSVKPIVPKLASTETAASEKIQKQKGINAAGNIVVNEDTIDNLKPPPLIKKWFTIKIVTASVDHIQGSSTVSENKFAENLDPNSKELQNLVQVSEKATAAEDGSESKVLEVSYSVFFTEVNGKLLPHHFTLATSKLSQETRDKASSIIKSLLRKQRKKILEETSGTQDKPPVTVEAHAPKKLKTNVDSKSTGEKRSEDCLKAICFFACIHCKELVDKKYLREHVLKTHMVQCSSCLIYLTSPDELLNHMCIVHDHPFSSCLKCWKKFPLDSDSSKCSCEFSCSICQSPFSNWLEYLDHEMSHFYEMAFNHAAETLNDKFIIHKLEKDLQAVRGPALVYPCRLCGKRYASKTEIEFCEHSYKCVSCKNVFISYALFVTHGCSLRYRNQRFKEKDKAKALSQNTDFIHVCPLCNETFNNGVLYGIHYPMCAESSGKLLEGRSATYCVSCPYCLTEFDSSQSFLRHYFDCRKENAYLCDYCQEFISNTHKTNHQQSCTQDVLCDNCGLSFSNRTRYRLHFRQHKDGSVFCKTLIKDDDGNPFETEPDPNIVMETIRNGEFNLRSCAYCGKMFDSVRNCIRHILAVHLDKVKTCPVCKITLRKSTNHLLTHRKTHSQEELIAATAGESIGAFRCPLCKKYFNSSYHKILHQIYHHDRETLKCTYCQKEFLSKVTLESHQVRCVEPPKKRSTAPLTQAAKFICQICDSPFDKFQEYVKHKKTHGGRVACDLCDKTFLSRAIMRNHRKQVHFGTPCTCEICGLDFSCVKNLQIHQRNIHIDIPPVICETCGKTFRTPKHLRKHITVHTGERPYKCTHCGRGYRLLGNLHQHEIKHHTGGSRPFECRVCKSTFAQLNNLHLHRRQMHPEIHKYQCPKCKFGYNDFKYYTKHVEGCNSKRVMPPVPRKRVNIAPRAPRTSVKHCPYCNEDVPSLRVHLLRRTDERPYHCQTCPKKFSYLCSLKNHEALHFNIKKFKCKICDKGFLGLKQYSLHLQIKHNDCFPLHCSHCNKGYNDNKYYYRHIEECNEFTTGPHYEANSKKLTPQCAACHKYFMKFNDLRIHAAMVHESQSLKKYQCKFCDSSYDSNALLTKHSKHHYKDRNRPGMFLCPKCQFQHFDFKTVLNHVCTTASVSKDFNSGPMSPSKRSLSSDYAKPAKRLKSGRVSKPVLMADFETDAESEDPDSSDHDLDSDTEIVELKKLSDMDDFDDYEEYKGETNFNGSTTKVEVQDTPQLGKIEEIEIVPESLIEETVADSSNFIYHCSFCKSNFDSLVTLQDHLRKDHGLDLENLEFQVL